MTTYKTRRIADYKSDGSLSQKKKKRRREPTSGLKPLEFFHKSSREWTDTPEDRAAVAAILKGGAK